MLHVLYGLLMASWIPVTAWYFISLVLYVTGRMSERNFWWTRAIADGLAAVRVLTEGLHDGVQWWSSLSIAYFLAWLAFDVWRYRNSDDDDDDWGKRLKSWAKSHIPKPSIVVLRPMGSPA
jgi:hypothetical protein